MNWLKILLSRAKNGLKKQFKRSKSPSELKNSAINDNIIGFIRSNGSKALPAREEILKAEVLIPCFNQGRYLSDALRSVGWNGIQVPVTVINDASTDETPAHIKRLSSSFDFQLIENRVNLNQAGSLNKAIEQSENNFFIILNADDCLMPYCLNTVIDLAKTHHDVRLVGGKCMTFAAWTIIEFARNLPSKLDYLPPMRIFGPEEATRYESASDIDMAMSSCAFFKSAWSSIGGFYPFEKRVCSFDDRDFQMRVSSLFKVGVIEEPLALWRQDSSTGRGQQ
jgi:GT2 family glycosyltransferase